MQHRLRHSAGLGYRIGASPSNAGYRTWDGIRYLVTCDGTICVRKGIREGYFVTDVTITALGFNGIEDTDWENTEAVFYVESEYWNTNLILQEDLNLWTTSRSGLELVDSLGGTNPTIQLPYLYKPSGTEYAYITDNGALDIAANDITLCGWVKPETVTIGQMNLFGKSVDTSKNGRFAIYAKVTTGLITAYIQSSGGFVAIDSAVNFFTSDWLWLCMDVDQATDKFRFYINNVQVGADADFTGTFSALGNAFEFNIGTGNSSTGAGVVYTSKASFSDVWYFHRKLSDADRLTIYNRGVVSGAKAHWDCVLREDNVLYDLSGNGYHMTGVNLVKTTKTAYGSAGSRQGLDVGYSRYTDYPNKIIDIAYTDAGVALNPVAPTGYAKEGDYAAIVNSHNGVDSKIRFSDDIWDRSDTTTCSYLAQLATLRYYYDASNVKDWHITELTNLSLADCFNDGYYGRNFSKFTGNTLNQIVCYADNKTGTVYDKILTYLNETVLDFDYYFVNKQVLDCRDTKVLATDGTKIYLSTDSGSTWSAGLTIGAETFFSHGRIFNNGTLFFCSNTKCYYSTDNLATYTQSTVLDEVGAPFVSGTLNQFRDLGYTSPGDESVYGHVWGSYIDGGTAVPHLFQTKDGITVKGIYKFQAPSIAAKHVHSVNYNVADNTFWIFCSDDVNNANLIKGEYDTGLDTWAFTTIGTGNAASIWQGIGMVFSGTDVWVNSEHNGVYRVPYAGIAVAGNWEKMFAPEHAISGQRFIELFGLSGLEMVVSNDILPELVVSNDGINFRYKQLVESDGVAFLLGLGGFYSFKGRLSNGYYVGTVAESGENIDNYDKGYSIFLKIKTTP